MSIQQAFPNINENISDDTGRVTAAWRRFFLSLWERSGGSSGGGGGVPGSVYTGSIMAWAGPLPATLPLGFIECDGSAISRSTFAPLFAVIGTTWGIGDGSTTFNIPNLASSFPMGVGTNTLGATGGHSQVTLVTNNLPAHNHGVTDPGHVHTLTDPGHTHTATPTDPGHTHVITDPGHNHTLTDPGHTHTTLQTSSTNTAGVAAGTATTGGTTGSNTTGITVQNHTTGSTNQTATTGITIANASNTTGATVALHTTGVTTTNTGTGAAFSILPTFATVNWLIKT